MIDAGTAPKPATAPPRLNTRFRGFLPVVVDVETGGFDWNRHALLEIAVVPLELDENGLLIPGVTASAHVVPALGLEIDPKSLEVTGIDIDHPFRDAKPERIALENVFAPVREAVKRHGCQRAILVGHNAHFDLNFLNAAVARSGHKRNPFHPFSVFDTVTLGGLAYGQTVLARAVQAAGFEWNAEEAHSAVYDAERTAQLFCKVVNAWPLPLPGA
ncbi:MULTISPECIES: ribonuclease T [unclassified Lysobacter]|uniref:ribonuclease T n=1 Tax=unclassified Lysobacter TaxID=2635362 RepID=UPI0006FF3772|nr:MULTISPECIES: ribonuclease T [unclassified Lysobacter]KQZ55629.1 ribonuclease T [Lysobacter sp. Root559]KRC31569.1 ribonuclease T [Lysobacter sp. Root76]KRD65476.1 ribonuclease T [Lysobacter sp. Root96]